MRATSPSRLLLVVTTALALPLLGLTPAAAAPSAEHGVPTISAVSPARGPVTGSTRITVRGSHLRGVRAVTIGDRRATHVHVLSASTVTASVPAQRAGSYRVQVRTATARSAATGASHYAYVARPSVTRVQLTHGSGLHGSQVTIHGHNLAGAVSVRFGSTPAVRGVVTGSTATVTVPAHAPGRLHVLISTAGGTSRTTADDVYQMPAPNTQRWDPQTYLEPEQNDLAGVSCPDAHTCFVADADNSVWRVDDGVWGEPTYLPRDKYPALPWQISCPTTDFCALAGRTHAYVYENGEWALGPEMSAESVSCLSAGHCLFISTYSYTVLNGGTWTTAPAPTDFLDQVACYDDTHCIAAGDGSRGVAYLWDGSTWTQMDSMHGPHGLSDLSCASATLCAAYDGLGGVSTWDGTTWSEPIQLGTDDEVGRDALSCRGDGCVLDDSQWLYTFHDGRWTRSQASSKDYDLVGCEYSATACLGQDTRGDIVSFDGSTWHATSVRLARVAPVTSLSCPTASFCGMSDESGNVYTYDGQTWTAPQKIGDTALQQSAVSCPSATYCLAVFADGTAATFTGDRWSRVASTHRVESVVSCTSPSFCLAGGADGAEVFDGRSWAAVPAFSGRVISVSCATTSFCVAVTPDDAQIFDGARFHDSFDDADLANADPHSISCPSAAFCLAVDGRGRQLEYRNGTWGDPVSTLIDYPSALSCFSDTFCQTFGDGSSQTYDGSVWTAVYHSGSFEGSMDVTGLSCFAPQECNAASGDEIFSSRSA